MKNKIYLNFIIFLNFFTNQKLFLMLSFYKNKSKFLTDDE